MSRAREEVVAEVKWINTLFHCSPPLAYGSVRAGVGGPIFSSLDVTEFVDKAVEEALKKEEGTQGAEREAMPMSNKGGRVDKNQN